MSVLNPSQRLRALEKKNESFRCHTRHINIDAKRSHFPFSLCFYCMPCVQHVQPHFIPPCSDAYALIFMRKKKKSNKKAFKNSMGSSKHNRKNNSTKKHCNCYNIFNEELMRTRCNATNTNCNNENVIEI